MDATTIISMLFIQLRIFDIIDILLVASLLYSLYYLLRGTAAMNIFLGIVSIFLLWRLVTLLRMELLGQILGAFVSVGFIALIIIFQPEIRQFLLALGTPRFIRKYNVLFPFLRIRESEGGTELDPLIDACLALSRKSMGALIVIVRQNKLFEFVQTGVIVDAALSQPLIENIFFKNSPLHDGAVIISDGRIRAAGCILPVTKKLDLPGRPGLRHRAGLGITEQSDAIAIIVSEETGRISIAQEGQLQAITDADELRNQLAALLDQTSK
ncbi:MAG TPA: diadenylate cyclase CdaA [Bacteroidales bacterium]|nr:diadenylate cyclase CdaA [Bacteroidales bacterium]